MMPAATAQKELRALPPGLGPCMLKQLRPGAVVQLSMGMLDAWGAAELRARS